MLKRVNHVKTTTSTKHLKGHNKITLSQSPWIPSNSSLWLLEFFKHLWQHTLIISFHNSFSLWCFLFIILNTWWYFPSRLFQSYSFFLFRLWSETFFLLLRKCNGWLFLVLRFYHWSNSSENLKYSYVPTFSFYYW